MKLYKVTHYAAEIPKVGFYVPLGYMCEVIENGKKYYIQGIDSKTLVPERWVDNGVSSGTLSKLPKSYPMSKKQGVWLKPNGDVILALDSNPVKDKKAIMIDTIKFNLVKK